jgi:rSAM/selenodomain-associated transferase 1
MAYPLIHPGSALNLPAQTCALVLMAKAPRVGLVKTRLTPELNAEQAAEASRCFIQDMAHNIGELSRDRRLLGAVAFTPAGEESAFDGLLPRNFFLLAQRGKDLGERLRHAADDLFAAGFGAVCLINSDSPTLPQSLLKEAAAEAALPGDRVVLGAASDGGYYLIGLKRPAPHLFSRIDWSTPRVLSQTMMRADEAGLDVVRLPEWYDVDDWESLKTLYREIVMPSGSRSSGLQGYKAEATARFLRNLVADDPDIAKRLASDSTEQRAP